MTMKLLLFGLLIIATINICRTENELEDYLMDNPYRELKIAPWSSMEDIKKKYNEMVKKYHPDKNKKAGAKEKFLRIQKAYEKLKTARRIENEDNLEEDRPIYTAIFEALSLIIGVVLVMAIFYFSIWASYKVIEYIWKYITCAAMTFVLIDKMFPHFFNSSKTQYTYSFLFSIIFFYSMTIFKYLKRLIKKKEL